MGRRRSGYATKRGHFSLSPPPLLAAPPTRPLFSPTSRYVNGSQSGEQSEGEEKFSAPKGVPRTPLFPRPGCAFVAGISIHCKPSFTLFDPTSPWLEISWIEVDIPCTGPSLTPSHPRRPVGGKQGEGRGCLETGQNIWDRSLGGRSVSVIGDAGSDFSPDTWIGINRILCENLLLYKW